MQCVGGAMTSVEWQPRTYLRRRGRSAIALSDWCRLNSLWALLRSSLTKSKLAPASVSIVSLAEWVMSSMPPFTPTETCCG